jgi:type IV pilus assembly protein PilA
MQLKHRKGNKGFTLVELLVVVLILAILMAVALPLYLDSVRDAGRKSCRANMQSIANAAQAWKVRTRSANFSALDITSDLTGDLGQVPLCPDGGDYVKMEAGETWSYADTNTPDPTDTTIPDGAFGVHCPNGHGDFVPGITTK